MVGKNYFDFLIEGNVILELKRGNKFAKGHIDQVYNYLKVKNFKLGILAYFGSAGLQYKRILNIT